MRLSLLETFTYFWLLLMLSLSLLLLLSSSSSSSPLLFWLVLELLNSNTYAIFVESKYWFCFGYDVSAKLLIGSCTGSDSVANDGPITTPTNQRDIANQIKKKTEVYVYICVQEIKVTKAIDTIFTIATTATKKNSFINYLCAFKVQ